MIDDKRSKNVVDLKKYEDPTGLAAKNLDFGLWMARNKKNIYKISVITLASLAAIFLLYSGYGYFYYFFFGRYEDKALEQDQSGVDLANYRLQNKPLDLHTSNARGITGNSGSDFIINLKNPNEKQYASFDFCFVSGGQKACGSDFILPNGEKDVMLLNSPIQISGGVTFELNNVTWQKLNAGEIPDWNAYKSQRLNFDISEIRFSSYGNGSDYLEFDIANRSPYAYFAVPLNITISQGNQIMAVNRYIVKDLISGEKRAIRLAWPEGAGSGGTIKITPDLNIISPSVYKPYTSN